MELHLSKEWYEKHLYKDEGDCTDCTAGVMPEHLRLMNELRMKCLSYDHKTPIGRSAMVAFRDILDPYCSEYKETDKAGKLEVLSQLLKDGIIPTTMTLYRAFVMFYGKDRPDIANAAADGLSFLLDHVNRRDVK